MDVQRRFLRFRMHLAALHLRRGDTNEGLNNPSKTKCSGITLVQINTTSTKSLRQQQDFREVHQQDLAKMKELKKFQNSTFNTLTRQNLIEDQNTIMELSGRLQELQNEVNCINDSKDSMDAESICSGNPHVASPPGLFPKHPPFEGTLRPLYSSQRQDEEPPNIWDTSGISGNVFLHDLLGIRDEKPSRLFVFVFKQSPDL